MRWFEYAGWMLLAGLMVSPAQAWSALGHRMVGDLAELRLDEGPRAEVRRLLEGENEPTLGGVASWADALRYQDPPRFRATSRWHYINARGGGCGFDEARDCADGHCIVAAINAQRRILADRRQSDAARRDALKFLVHFVGDVHQPLHAGSREDSGGNGFQVSLRRDAGPAAGTGATGNAGTAVRSAVEGTNLHTVWDSRVLASAGLSRVQYVAQLRESLPPDVGRVDAAAPMAWARESCALVDAAALYPPTHTIDSRYLEAHRPLAEQRIVTAAVRLAALLNAVLGAD